MSMFDDDRPAKRPAIVIGQDLSTLSLDELDERIAALRAEIERIEAAIAAKRSSRDAAASVFKR